MDPDDTASNPQADAHLPVSGEFDPSNVAPSDDSALNTADEDEDVDTEDDSEEEDDFDSSEESSDLDDDEDALDDEEDAPLSDEVEPSDDAFENDGQQTPQP